MNRVDFVGDLIGGKWKPGGKGPMEWDCYHLTQYVQKNLFGREMPWVDIPESPSLKWLMTAIRDHPERDKWEVIKPSGPIIVAPDGAIVLMARSNMIAHIGTYFRQERRILHCEDPSGVCYEPVALLKAVSWQNMSFWVPK
jgi:cell wall-associated NlpC family hydrolase